MQPITILLMCIWKRFRTSFSKLHNVQIRSQCSLYVSMQQYPGEDIMCQRMCIFCSIKVLGSHLHLFTQLTLSVMPASHSTTTMDTMATFWHLRQQETPLYYGHICPKKFSLAVSQSESQMAFQNERPNQLQAHADGSSKLSNIIGAQSIKALKVDEALESLTTFWHLRQREIPRERMRLFMLDARLPLHHKLPEGIVLKVMTYIEKCHHHVQLRKDAINHIGHVLDFLNNDPRAFTPLSNLSGSDYILILTKAKVRLQEYTPTEFLAAKSSADALRLLGEGCSTLANHGLFRLVKVPLENHGLQVGFKRAVQLVRELLVQQLKAMMSGFTKVLFVFKG